MSDIDQRDPTFVADLVESQTTVELVAGHLRALGYEVTVPELRVRPHAAERLAYSDHGDLFVKGRFEVKHRPDLHFEAVSDFPYPSVIVDVAHSWDRAQPKPWSYVIVNAPKTCALVIGHHTHRHWTKEERFDRHVGRARLYYLCPLRLCALWRFGDSRA